MAQAILDFRPFRSQTFSPIIPQTCPQSSSFYTQLSAYEDGTDSVPKLRHIKFRRRRITQKKAYNESKYIVNKYTSKSLLENAGLYPDTEGTVVQ